MNPARLETRIQELLDGVLAEEHWEELRDALEHSEEARDLYCRYAWLSSGLRERSKEIQSLHDGGTLPSSAGFAPRSGWKRMRHAVLVAAAVLVLVLGSLQLVFDRDSAVPSPVRFTSSPGSSYALINRDGMGEGTSTDSVLWDGSRLRVSAGAVELSFPTGVKSIVVGPADLTLLDKAHLHLREGEARFVVPAEAVGMRVTTKYLDVVDLGTEFGIRARSVDHHEVHVFKGKVRATAMNEPIQTEILVTGEARRREPLSGLRTIPCQPSTFLSALPEKLAAYAGPLDLREGVHSLGKAGVGYSVFDSVNTMENDGGVVGNLQISMGGNWSAAFSQPVDLRIEPTDLLVDMSSSIWNGEEDFGRLSCSPDAVVTVDDPGAEIELTELSPGSFEWKFLKAKTDKQRFPVHQSWAIRIKATEVFTLSKSSESGGRSVFGFHVNSASPESAELASP